MRMPGCGALLGLMCLPMACAEEPPDMYTKSGVIAAARGDAESADRTASSDAVDASSTPSVDADLADEFSIECYTADRYVAARLGYPSTILWDQCLNDSDCTWRSRTVHCPDRGVLIGTCPHPIATRELNAAVRMDELVRRELCTSLPLGCKNIASCVEQELRCIDQRCRAVRPDGGT